MFHRLTLGEVAWLSIEKMQNWKSAKEPIVILLKVCTYLDTKIDGRLDKEAGYVQETELTAHFDVQKKRCRKVIKPSTGLYMQEYIYFTDHLCRPLLIDVMNWESQPYLPGKLLQGYIYKVFRF